MQFGIDYIPPEILLQIFHELDYRTLLTSIKVCRRWKYIIREDRLSRIKADLARLGVRRGPPSELKIEDAFKYLCQRQRSWSNLELSRISTIHWELGEFRASENVVALIQSGQQLTLAVNRFQSSVLIEDAKHWETNPITPCDSFEIDAAQDLIVSIRCVPTDDGNPAPIQIYLSTISSGLSHPSAASSFMEIVIPPEHAPLADGYAGYQVVIAGDHVGIVCEPSRKVQNTLWVVNWKLGEVKLELSSKQDMNFCFLDETFVLLYATDISWNKVPCLLVYDVSAHGKERTSVEGNTYVCAFELLDPPKCATIDAKIRSSLALPSAISDALVNINLSARKSRGRTETLDIFVRSSSLRKRIAEVSQRGDRASWFEEWAGEDAFVQLQDGDCFQTDRPDFMSGLRFANLTRDADGQMFLTVNDFNPARIKQVATYSEGHPQPSGAHLVPSSENPIQRWNQLPWTFPTGQPIVRQTVRLPEELDYITLYSQCVLTDDGVILASPRDPERGIKVMHF
ncbi:hypothetical protein DENSPDRAFT_931898 [Dentipellis sp. KUC8613]|nr:hypothetical protein DENSPDRAFT_931898 [Dentipellis sp. KUC8613]